LRESGHGGNAAHVAVVSGHPDESLKSPVSSPGVLDDPVVRSAVNSPSNGKDSVVELGGRAVGVTVNSRVVELEGRLRSINSNASGTQIDLGLEVVLVSLVHVDVGLEGSSAVGSFVVASSVLSGVGVAGFGVNSLVGDDVVHGLGHESSIASLVSLAGGAIHQVLFRQRNELLGGDEVASLSGSSGGERPARSALSLVLDGGNGSSGVPVPAGGKSLRGRGADGAGGGVFGSQIELGEFLDRKVSKFVHGDGEAQVLGIVSVDEVQVALEGVVSNHELIVVVRLLVLLHPKGEGRLVFCLRKSESESAEGCKHEDCLHRRLAGLEEQKN
jgi:hypothetical protein